MSGRRMDHVDRVSGHRGPAPAGWIRDRTVRGLLPGVYALMLSSCALAPKPTPTAPEPWPTPRIALSPAFIPSHIDEAPLVPPTVHELPDEILTTPMLRDPSFVAEVDRWVSYFQGRGARWVPEYLGRMGRYASVVDSILEARRLPGSLRYLPVIESGYNPHAVSRARAVGLWQLMEGTARGLGMTVTPLMDERRSPDLSTHGAAQLLGDLREEFGSWFFALAAYNAGPNRVRRILDRHAPLVPPSDSLLWALRGHLPRETREFVPKLYGAMAVAGAPERFGLDRPPAEPLRFDVVVVPDATTLDVVARAAEVAEEEIRGLNPEFVRGVTPPGRDVMVRVPRGQGPVFEENYRLIPPDERVSFVEHRVAAGETLSHIAVRYGIRVADLQAANPAVRPRSLRVGTRLTVPVAPGARSR